MEAGTHIVIPYALSSSFRHILPSLRGGEHGVYMRAQENGVGETVYQININGYCYMLREGEFIEEEK